MGKLLFSFCLAVCAFSRVWGINNRLNTNGRSIDPMAANIDRGAFKQQYSLDEADVIRIWNEINKANKTGNGVQLIGTSFIPVPLKRRCEDGPIKILHQLQPNTFISPLPTRLSCTGLYCKDFDCLVRKKKTICWWGLQYVIRKTRNRFVSVPLGIKRVCYETHIECGCRKCQDFTTPEQCIKPCPNLRFSNLETKCYWAYPKQVKSDPTTKVLSRGECSCCYPQECIPPLVFSYETCDCECPIVCGNGFILNEKKCSCECDLDQVCPPPKVLDPEKCICKCPFGSIEDQATGDCIGQCDQFSGSDNCEKIFCVEDPTKHCVLTNGKCECPTSVSSCTEIKDSATCNKTVCPGTNSSMCKFYHYVNPSTGQKGCQCGGDDDNNNDGCCKRKSSAPPGTDCSTYNMLGSKKCNAVWNRTCEWVCPCKNITDAKVCVESTCTAQHDLTCRYSRKNGCECPSCCKDHPHKSSAFDCALLHLHGTKSCNEAVDGRTCQWTCPCSDIDNKETCLRSTCIDDPEKKCVLDGRRCSCK